METTKQIVDFGAAGTIRQAAKYFAPKVGEAPSLVAGSSRSLLSPTALEELFLFQRTANGAGGTGAAVFQSIKGNSVVANQIVPQFTNPVTVASVVFTPGANGVIDAHGTATDDDAVFYLTDQFTLLKGRSYIARGCPAGGSASTYSFRDTVAGRVSDTGSGQFITRDSDGACRLAIVVKSGTTVSHLKFRPEFFDITKFALSGIASVADFNKFYPAYIAPNPGAIKNNCATGMVTDGFNLWDEEWEVGTYGKLDGAKVDATDRIRSTNAIRVTPGTTYYANISNSTYADMLFYDANGGYISYTSLTGSGTFNTPTNCCYLRFSLYSNYGTTYKKDICINLSGSRNGEYEPHWSDTLDLPITTATGKLNGEGESVVITPNGLAGVGTFFDEAIVEKGMWTKTKNRLKEVDMGTLAVEYQTGTGDAYPRFRLTLSDIGGARNILCEKYPAVSYNTFIAAGADKTICSLVASGYVYVKDSAYTDAATFKAAMSGVKLIYELATPQVYVLDTPVPVTYQVDKDGTQTILPQGVDESGVPMTAPFAASIFYPEQMDKVYLTAADFKNFLDAAVEGGAITAYTMEWNAATGSYDFTVNQAAATLAAPASTE